MAQHAGIFRQLALARRFRSEIQTALELDPRDVQALRDLAEFYLLAPGLAGGDPKKAETVAHQTGCIDAVECFLAEARIAEFRKDHARIEDMLRRAAEVRPLAYKAQLAAAQFYLAKEHANDEAAEVWARKALAIDGGRIGAYCVLATVYAGRGDWRRLEAALSSAAREVPDDPTPYYRAAERLLSDNRLPANAEQYLRLYLAQQAEGNQPSASDAHWKLGVALSAQGQVANAISEWKIAVQLDPESPAAHELKRSRNAKAGGTPGAKRNGGTN
jgi:Tfp pilus assembly protein PilF